MYDHKVWKLCGTHPSQWSWRCTPSGHRTGPTCSTCPASTSGSWGSSPGWSPSWSRKIRKLSLIIYLFTFYQDPHSFWNFIFPGFWNQNYRSSDPYHFEYLHVRLVILHNLSVMTALLFFLLLSRRLIIVCWWASSDHPLIKQRFIDQTWAKLPTISFMVCLVGNIKKIELI